MATETVAAAAGSSRLHLVSFSTAMPSRNPGSDVFAQGGLSTTPSVSCREDVEDSSCRSDRVEQAGASPQDSQVDRDKSMAAVRSWNIPGYLSSRTTPRVFPGASSPPHDVLGMEPFGFRGEDRDSGVGGEESGEQVLSVSFNQDNSCFACGTTSGFRVFTCSAQPVKESLCRVTPVTSTGEGHQNSQGTQRQGLSSQVPPAGGVQRVEMLYRSNLMALVGGGPSPRFPANKVVVWDDDQGRCVGELVFRSEVKGVRLRRERVVVLLEQKIYIYSLVDLRLLGHIDTLPASQCARVVPSATVSSGRCEAQCSAVSGGLFAVSQAPHNFVLACLGLQKGQVRVEHLDVQKSRMITAHESCIAALALTPDGSRLATASVRGTLARIFCTHQGTMLQEVRRGADRAEIYSLAFSPQGAFLALTSDKGTAHVFAMTGTRSGTPLRSSSSSHTSASKARPRTSQGTSSNAGALSCALQAAHMGPEQTWHTSEASPPCARAEMSRFVGSSASSSEVSSPGYSLAQSEGMMNVSSHRRRVPSPLHPAHRGQLSQHQHWHRLRQSQSCPPRRWVADLARGDVPQSLSASAHTSIVVTQRDHVEYHREHEQDSHSPPSIVCNPGSSLAFMRGVLPRYFSSEWSVAQFRDLPAASRSVVAFGAQKHTLLVVTFSGRLFRLLFDPVHGGEMVVEEAGNIFDLELAPSH